MSEVMQHISNTQTGISLSDKARAHLIHYLEKDEQFQGVRFSVKKTGCSGLSYVVDYLLEPKEQDLTEPLNERYSIYIDKASYPYLKGMHVDYVTEGLNSKFVFKNPNQTGQCGCGESFTVDEIKD
jgi:iron-sulfur cluster assembly protein